MNDSQCDYSDSSSECDNLLKNDAVEILRNLETKDAIRSHDYVGIAFCICPKCNRMISNQNYCSRCATGVKW